MASLERAGTRGAVCLTAAMMLVCMSPAGHGCRSCQTGVPVDLIVHRDLQYAPGQRQTLDLIRPRTWEGGLPAVLLVHGGGWVDGHKAQLDQAWAFPLAQAGFMIANVEYRTAEYARAPAAMLDVRSAAAWFCRESARLGADVRRLVFMGMSAGAHLVLMAALPPIDDAELGVSCLPAAMINLWGITDLRHLDGELKPLAERWIPEADRRDDVLARWSPVCRAAAAAPPLLTIHASRDTVVPITHARQITAAYRGAGRTALLLEMDADWHGPSPTDYPAVLTAVVDYLRKAVRANV